MAKPQSSGDNRTLLMSVLVGLSVFIALGLTRLHSFILFHSLAEMFSIVVACGIFMIFWNARRFLNDGFFFILGVSYLFIAVIDMIHTLSYSGMGVFTGYGANLPTQLWIAARYLQALSVLAALLMLGRHFSARATLAAYALMTGLVFALIFVWDKFPECYVEGQGLTPFKRNSEYVICGLFTASIAMLALRRERFDRMVFRLFLASLLFTIGSELMFTLYTDVSGYINATGHLLKIVAFYCVYKAFIEAGLRQPYGLLFRDMKRKEDQLRELTQTLEQRVAERTADLARSHQALRQSERLAAIGQVTAGLSHESRNAIQRTLAALRMLEKRLEGDTDLLQLLQHALNAQADLQQVYESVREYAAPMKLDRAPADLKRIWRDTWNNLADRRDGRETRLIEEADGLNLQCEVEAFRIQQVFRNLMENSLEAGPDPLSITIRCQETELDGRPALQVSLRDNGPGMAPELAHCVFEPFYTTKTKGTGLGMAIVKRIVDSHGGRISLVTEPGAGLEVLLVLPRQAADQ